MKTTDIILLVKQTKGNSEKLPEILKALGFHVIKTESIDSAMIFLKSDTHSKIDVVIISTEIIRRDSLDFIDWIRKFHKETVIMVTSGGQEDESICNVLQIQFFRKPLTDINLLDEAINNAIVKKIAKKS